MQKIATLILLSLALSGCSAHSAVAGQPGTSTQDATGGPKGWVRDGGPGLAVVALPDPSFNGMVATFVAVPKGWHVAGQMTSNECTHLPDAAWSAHSSDGKSVFDILPKFGWRWGAGAQYSQGCDPLKGTPTAAQFLKVFAAKLPGHLQVQGQMPIAEAYRSREVNFTDKSNAGVSRMAPAYRFQSSGDVAAVRAVDDSGHELRIRSWLQCRQNNHGGDCFAKVDVLQTSKGRLDELAAQIDTLNLTQEVPASDWLKAYSDRQQQIAGVQFKKLTELEKSGNDMLRQQYLDSSARLKQEHEAGMQQIKQQGDSAMNGAWNTMHAQTTASSDWRDYAADQQTVSGANGTYKTSSQYTNVWSSPYGPALSDGRSFGATDNTVNPNSATDNTWTKDHPVHGNGQEY